MYVINFLITEHSISSRYFLSKKYSSLNSKTYEQVINNWRGINSYIEIKNFKGINNDRQIRGSLF